MNRSNHAPCDIHFIYCFGALIIRKMDWICFIFKRSFHHYLVVGESKENAYEVLANRQSISVEKCKKEYELLDWMNGMGSKVVVKI